MAKKLLFADILAIFIGISGTVMVAGAGFGLEFRRAEQMPDLLWPARYWYIRKMTDELFKPTVSFVMLMRDTCMRSEEAMRKYGGRGGAAYQIAFGATMKEAGVNIVPILKCGPHENCRLHMFDRCIEYQYVEYTNMAVLCSNALALVMVGMCGMMTLLNPKFRKFLVVAMSVGLFLSMMCVTAWFAQTGSAIGKFRERSVWPEFPQGGFGKVVTFAGWFFMCCSIFFGTLASFCATMFGKKKHEHAEEEVYGEEYEEYAEEG